MGDESWAYEGLDIYRVQTCWGTRRGVTVQQPTRFWRRTWQVEWPGCQTAQRGWTRNGALVRAVRSRLQEARRD